MLTFGRKYYPSDNTSASLHSSFISGTSERLAWLNIINTWFVIPALGILIPNISGLLQASDFKFSELIFQYFLFIGVALIIYKGNMFFLNSIKLRFNESSMPYLKIVGIYFMVNIVYSGVISLSALSAWNRFINHEHPFAKPVIISTLLILISVLFINNLYEIFYLQSAKEASAEKMELLKSAKLQAEIEVLTNQIDPHFMFNALTSLSYLMQQKPEEADKFNTMLAAQYKYVLKHKSSHFVRLEQEINFCQQYFGIQQLRFGHSVLLQIIGGHHHLNSLKVPPLSVQTLLENALKHNCFSDDNPLLVQILISEGKLQVINNIQPLTYPAKSTGIGLANLNQRVVLLTNTPLKVERTALKFSVTLPVCRL